MTPDHDEILSSFFDGEDVDPDLVAACLQEPGALETLIEFARLRRTARADAGRPSEEFCEAMRERLARGESRRVARRRLVDMSLAASLALAAALGGFGLRAVLDKEPPLTGTRPIQVTTVPRPGNAVDRPPASAGPGRPTAPAPARATVPQPALRIRFDEWHDVVL